MKVKGIFVRNTRGVKYADALVRGYKACETRNRNTLSSLAGERVAVIRTGGKETMVIGYITFGLGIKTPYEYFDMQRDMHLVPPGSKYDCKPNGFKWLYFLSDWQTCEPYPLPKAATRHGRVWCEWEE